MQTSEIETESKTQTETETHTENTTGKKIRKGDQCLWSVRTRAMTFERAYQEFDPDPSCFPESFHPNSTIGNLHEFWLIVDGIAKKNGFKAPWPRDDGQQTTYTFE